MLSSRIQNQKSKSSEIIDAALLLRLGNFLKDVRERKRLSLNDIRDLTCIPIQHLNSIENGLRENLPEDIFLIGFIKKYSKALGLKDEHIFSQLSSYVRTKTVDDFDLLFSTRSNNVIEIKKEQNFIEEKQYTGILKPFSFYIVIFLFLISSAIYVIVNEFKKINHKENIFSYVVIDKSKNSKFEDPNVQINLNEVESWVEEEKNLQKKPLQNVLVKNNIPIIKTNPPKKIQTAYKITYRQAPKPKPILAPQTIQKPMPTNVQKLKRIMID